MGCPGVVGPSKQPSKAKLLMPGHAAIVVTLSAAAPQSSLGLPLGQEGGRKQMAKASASCTVLIRSFLEAQWLLRTAP